MITLTALVALSLAQQQDTKQQIHFAYSNLEWAYNHKKVDAVMSWTAPDYKWTLLDGKTLSRKDSESALTEQLKQVQGGKWSIEIQNMAGKAPLVMVVAQYRFEGTMIDPAKKAYKSKFSTTERQNWLQTPNGWRILSDQIITQKTKSDGLQTMPNVNSGQAPQAQPSSMPPNGKG